MAELTPYQRDILIRTALGEARGEGPEGMADVVQVIFNRANSGRFPSDPARVALQPQQFSTWNKGRGGNNPQQFSPNSAAYKEAARIVDLVASGRRPDPLGGALDYHAESITPYWAASKDQYGTITRNGHVYYPRHPVPPGDIPTVATLLDVTRRPPTPDTQSNDMRLMRASTTPSQLIPDTFASLPSPRTNRLVDAADLKAQTVRDVTPRLNRSGSVLSPADVVFGPELDYADAGRLPTPPQPARQAPPSRPTSEIASIYAGGGPTRPRVAAPAPATQSPHLAASRTGSPELTAALNARYPTQLPQIASAAPPRIPQRSAPMPASQSLPLSSARLAAATADPALRSALEASIRPSNTNLTIADGPAIPAPAYPRVDVGLQDALRRAAPDRLPSEPLPTQVAMPQTVFDQNIDVAELTGQVSPAGLQVATMLDTRPAPPLPIRRPGVGGPVPTPAQVATARVAPVPMPRLNRPGIFGTPKLGNWNVPLPGPLGMIQRATAAMNNASGPFNNGADNLLYNAMRGGDFNTPGAAVGQAGGYLYAPRQGGGYLNVGRAVPGMSAAETYDRRNANTRAPRNAAERAEQNSRRYDSGPDSLWA